MEWGAWRVQAHNIGDHNYDALINDSEHSNKYRRFTDTEVDAVVCWNLLFSP